MEGFEVSTDTVVVRGDDRTLTYRPRRITLSDGTWIMHESRGGDLSSVWAADLGRRFVEVVHLGDGPIGGELILVVPADDVLAIGDLYQLDVTEATPSWAAAIDLVLGMCNQQSTIYATTGIVTHEELEAFHQRLLGLIHG